VPQCPIAGDANESLQYENRAVVENKLQQKTTDWKHRNKENTFWTTFLTSVLVMAMLALRTCHFAAAVSPRRRLCSIRQGRCTLHILSEMFLTPKLR